MSDSEPSYGQRLRDKGIRLSSAAVPSRTARPKAGFESKNSWERGKATDDRGMPYLDENLNPIGVKRFGESYRRKFEKRDEKRASERLTAPPPEGDDL